MLTHRHMQSMSSELSKIAAAQERKPLHPALVGLRNMAALAAGVTAGYSGTAGINYLAAKKGKPLITPAIAAGAMGVGGLAGLLMNAASMDTVREMRENAEKRRNHGRQDT